MANNPNSNAHPPGHFNFKKAQLKLQLHTDAE